jgi:hypothetical protein
LGLQMISWNDRRKKYVIESLTYEITHLFKGKTGDVRLEEKMFHACFRMVVNSQSVMHVHVTMRGSRELSVSPGLETPSLISYWCYCWYKTEGQA